jgi:hypothetical protein
LFGILVAAVPLISLEHFGFALTKVLPDLFDQRQHRGRRRTDRAPVAGSCFA